MVLQSSLSVSFAEEWPTHRLFFAVMVPANARHEIVDWFDDFRRDHPFRSRPISPERLHLTLMPIFAGDGMPDNAVQFAQRVGNAIRFERFVIDLDRVLTYRNRKPNKPFVLATHAGSEAFARLGGHVDETCSVLSGTRAKPRRPVAPHVTLAWDRLTVAPQAVAPIRIPVREITLVHSIAKHRRYNIVGRWPLVA